MSYRLTIEISTEGEYHRMDWFGLEGIGDVLRGMRGDSPSSQTLALTLEVDGRAVRDPEEIARTLTALHPGTLAARRAELERTGLVIAGPLELGRDELRWGDEAPIQRAEVEAIELFDNSPVELRVMKRGKVWPYGKARTAKIPDVVEIVRIAHELGYPVRGLALLEALFSAMP